MSAYRVSCFRSAGWLRLGMAAAAGVLFLTPMMWSVGAFGQDEDTLRRASVFLFCGLWLSLSVGYLIGWALRGFAVRVHDEDAEDAHAPPHRPMPAPPHPPAPAHGAAAARKR